MARHALGVVQYVPLESPSADVELIFALDGYEPTHQRERLVPDGRTTLVIELDGRERHIYDRTTGDAVQSCTRAWVSGVQTQHIVIGEVSPARLAAVRFVPGRARAVLGVDQRELVDRVVSADEVLGPDVFTLRERLRDAPTSVVPAAIATWLDAGRDESRMPDPFVDEMTQRLLAEPSRADLTAEVDASGRMSYRRFVDQFRTHVGPAPKTYQRILRFAATFATLAEPTPVDWSALATDLGYADQAHFIRHFRDFSGYRPTEFVARGFDRPNFFPDDD